MRRLSKEKARLIERVRNEYNKTLDKSVIGDGFEEWERMNLFHDFESWIYFLKKAGLRGNLPVWRKESKNTPYNLLVIFKSSDVVLEDVIKVQTGVNPAVIEKWNRDKGYRFNPYLVSKIFD